jgi:predicted phage terminase large subunit-like protein
VKELTNYLTEAELEELEILLSQEFGTPTTNGLSLTDFKRKFWAAYQHQSFMELIDEKLTQVTQYVLSGGQTGISRLMIFLPPRHSKTTTTSRLFPAWFFTQAPHLRIIMASYGATLAYRNSRIVRNLISRSDYQATYPNVRLASDSSAVDEWDIADNDGGLIAAGVGGGITGHGGNLIILDDLVKSRAEAESETYRQRVKDWYENDLLTRLEEPGGAIILMMTRWHMDDLAGYLLESERDKWDVLSLPALALENDPLGREVGEALWAERYSVDILNERRARMGEYAFNSLYQQSPMPSKGGLFDIGKIEVIDLTPECKQIVRFYDLAVTAKKHSDYTAGAKIGITQDEDIIILHIYRVQKVMPDVEKDIAQNANLDGRKTYIRLEAEKAGIVQLDYLLRRPDMRGYTIDAVPPVGDKYTRAQPFASRVNAGKVKMLRGAWNRALLDEMAMFPMGAHDDQIDALSGAYEMCATPRDAEYYDLPNIFDRFNG